MRPRTVGDRADSNDGGFTLIELLVVMLVMAIVLSIAGSALYSLTMAGNRNTAMIGEEQSVSVALTQLTRDLRSASSITIPSGASPSDQLEVSDLNPQTNVTTSILWVHDPTANTLTREEQSSGGAWTEAGFLLSRLTNTTQQPIFTYFDDSHNEVPGGTTTLPIPASYGTTVAANATAVLIDVRTSSATSAVGNYRQGVEVALTNLVNDNNPTGQGT